MGRGCRSRWQAGATGGSVLAPFLLRGCVCLLGDLLLCGLSQGLCVLGSCFAAVLCPALGLRLTQDRLGHGASACQGWSAALSLGLGLLAAASGSGSVHALLVL